MKNNFEFFSLKIGRGERERVGDRDKAERKIK